MSRDVTTRKRDAMRGKPFRAVLAGLTLVVGVVGCGHAGTTAAEPGQAGVSATSQTMSGPELAALWDSPESEPCDRPGPLLGDELQAVADSLPDLPNIQTVKSRLATVTAQGPYIHDDLHNLHAALLQTQYQMSSTANHRGADASGVTNAREDFSRYLDSVIADLQSGAAPTPLSNYEYDMADTCD